MSTVPLLTKLYLPAARQELVPRPRLLQQLAQGLTGPLTLISAPAGFGKTTLISEWRASRPGLAMPLASLALDEDDNDPARFLSYVIAALATLKPGLGDAALAGLQAPTPPPLKHILTTLINELGYALSTASGLVLDDYHHITARPVHEALAFLLDHLPSQLHLIITTRADPPLPLTRLRARNQLVEIRADDLRFTPAETAAFLNQVMGLALPVEAITTLTARTEGWVSGLQLAALSLKGRADITGFINSFAGRHRYIIDYLVEEVLQRQPADIQRFLLQTAILNRLSGPLCDALLTGEAESTFPPPPAQATLEYLEHANLFIIPLDDERRWYRYHHLFSEVLSHQLHRLYPEELPELHRRAAAWYEQNGFMAEAIPHALPAGDFERAVRLVEQLTPELLKRGEMQTLAKWLQALPAELLQTRPQLAIYYAWALLLNGQITETESWLQTALQVDATPAMAGQVAAIRAFYTLLQGDIAGGLAFSQQALQLLPEDNLLLHGIARLTAGLSDVLNGDIITAIGLFTEIADRAQAAGNYLTAVMALAQAAENYKAQGQLQRSAELYHQALGLATLPGGQVLPSASMIYAGLGTLAYEWNELETAQAHLDQSLALSQQLGQTGAIDSYILQVWLKQAQGDLIGALEVIHQTDQIMQSITALGQPLLDALRVRLWLIGGNLASALAWPVYRRSQASRTGESLPPGPDLPYIIAEVEQLTLARLLIAQGRATADPLMLQDALSRLETLRQAAENLGRLGSVIETWLLQALAHHAQGHTPQALSALKQALTLTEPEGHLRLFLDEGPPMAALLATFLTTAPQPLNPTYLNKLLTAFPSSSPDKSPIVNRKSEIANLFESLSDRELEILRLIAAGHSNDEIAQTLIIALGTVKKHINNIYGKLGVHSRTQALVRAKELGLL